MSLLDIIFFAAVGLVKEVMGFSPIPSVPERVAGLAGSCVVIPCFYSAPQPPPRGGWGGVHVRLMVRGGGHLFPLQITVFNSEEPGQVTREFQGRASLFGRMSDGDCSVKLDQVHPERHRVYELALKGPGDLLWGKPCLFNLEVTESPESPVISGSGSATDGQTVSLNCTVHSPCPSRHPTLSWHWERGARPNSSYGGEVEVLRPAPHLWVLRTALSFTASYLTKPRLRCQAHYPGGQTASVLKELHVTFPPRDVQVLVQTLVVQQGGSVLLGCACKADPPVSEYCWAYTQNGRTQHIHRYTHAIRLHNVTRGMTVHCSAHNPIGRGESEPTSLDIQYKPLILPLSSACTLEDSKVTCHCSVDSNPRAELIWSVNGSAPPSGYNVSVTADSGTVQAWLRGRMDERLNVVCTAVNVHGSDSLTLQPLGEVTSDLWWLLVPAASITVVLSSLLLLLCCRKKTARRTPVVCHEELVLYQDRTPLYINCTEVMHVYTNGSYQRVYHNTTPLFVQTKQTRHMARRGERQPQGRKERRKRSSREEENPASSENETAVYLEVL